MSSTNKTTNYNLSQFIGTDKPAWLADYNQDMSKIDTAIKSADDSAVAAGGKADANTTNIGDLTYLSTSSKTNLVSAINEVNTKTDTAQNTANSAFTTASEANTKVNELESALNLTNISTCTASKSANISSISNVNVKCATNNDRSLFKLYGSLRAEAPAQTTNASVTFSNTGLSGITESYTIEGAVLSFREGGYVSIYNLQVNTDGTVTIPNIEFGTETATRLYIAPILYFNKNFGD